MFNYSEGYTIGTEAGKRALGMFQYNDIDYAQYYHDAEAMAVNADNYSGMFSSGVLEGIFYTWCDFWRDRE